MDSKRELFEEVNDYEEGNYISSSDLGVNELTELDYHDIIKFIESTQAENFEYSHEYKNAIAKLELAPLELRQAFIDKLIKEKKYFHILSNSKLLHDMNTTKIFESIIDEVQAFEVVDEYNNANNLFWAGLQLPNIDYEKVIEVTNKYGLYESLAGSFIFLPEDFQLAYFTELAERVNVEEIYFNLEGKEVGHLKQYVQKCLDSGLEDLVYSNFTEKTPFEVVDFAIKIAAEKEDWRTVLNFISVFESLQQNIIELPIYYAEKLLIASALPVEYVQYFNKHEFINFCTKSVNSQLIAYDHNYFKRLNIRLPMQSEILINLFNNSLIDLVNYYHDYGLSEEQQADIEDYVGYKIIKVLNDWKKYYCHMRNDNKEEYNTRISIETSTLNYLHNYYREQLVSIVDKLNISFFSRYNTDQLIYSVEAIQSENAKGVAIVAKSDHNGGFSGIGATLNSLFYDAKLLSCGVIIIETDNLVNVGKSLLALAPDGGFSFVIIAGHGSANSISLGEYDYRNLGSMPLLTKDLVNKLSDKWSKIFTQGVPIALISCSTAQGDESIAASLSNKIRANVTGPTVDTRALSVSLTKGNNGRYQFLINYSGSEQKTFSAGNYDAKTIGEMF